MLCENEEYMLMNKPFLLYVIEVLYTGYTKRDYVLND